MITKIGRFFSLWRSQGISAISLALWVRLEDLLFDFVYRTDTARHMNIETLTESNEIIQHSYGYQPTRTRALLKLFVNLKLSNQLGFVDLGCGKGRVLMLASRYKFNVIRGVEFSSVLCEIAKKNMEKYSKHFQSADEIIITNSDVCNYEISKDENIFFMFNPFDSEIMEKVLLNLKKSLENAPRPIFIIYNNPIHDSALKNAEFLKYKKDQKIYTTKFRIFSNVEI